MKMFAYLTVLAIAVSATHLAAAGDPQFAPVAPGAPLTATLSNNIPRTFGMDAAEASHALGEPLNYVSGGPGDEIYLAVRNYVGGSRLFNHRDRLFLQFRSGRLTGWKGDWGHNWMWQ